MNFSFKIFGQRLGIAVTAIFIPVVLDQIRFGTFPDNKMLYVAGISAVLAAAGIDYHAFTKAKKVDKENKELRWQESGN